MQSLLKALKTTLHKNLALRYLMIASTAVLLSQSVVGAVQMASNYRRQINALEEKAYTQGQFLSEVAPEAIVNLDFLYLETLVRQTSKDIDIIYCVILDANGAALTRYLNRQDPLVDKITVSLNDEGNQILSVIEGIDQQDGIRILELPIVVAERSIGVVKIGYSSRAIYNDLLRAAITTLMAVFTASLLLAVITFIVFKRAVHTPLRQLVKFAAALESGQLEHRASLSYPDEIGQLGRALNRMAAELQKTLKGLAEARDTAISASQAKSEFLANMSHELRTPLNAILGYAHLLERDPTLDKKQHESVSIVHQSGTHLLSLVNDILEMSKIEAGQTSITPIAFDLHNLLQLVRQMFQPRAKEKKIALIFENMPNLPQYIEADESKLRQVLINLIGNGIKFTQHGGVSVYTEVIPQTLTIVADVATLDAAQPATTLQVTVEDTGPGIEPDALSKIFEAFTQTQVGKTAQQGTGLGLPISRKYVELMGGELQVSSNLGEGSAFRFTVPVLTATASAIAHNSQPPRQVVGLAANQPDYRLLVVEDVLESRRLLVSLLELVGFNVREAENGMIALKIWEEWSPDLIWMDMRMPIMDGYEATQQIREIEHSRQSTNDPQSVTVILALTAFAFEEHRQRALTVGCDDYVRKPFQEHEVFDKLQQYLNVEYIYEDTEVDIMEGATVEADTLPIELDEESVAEQLQHFSDDVRSQLAAAAVSLDKEVALEIVKTLESQDSQLAYTLRTWVNGFRFDKISQALEA
ncbi:MAG: response regulator [Leptolyngbyaceae cyanobacterium MAG.088]|nr:response regulator [Leptolyngbyaceae cyanobacterium MAG.088]